MSQSYALSMLVGNLLQTEEKPQFCPQNIFRNYTCGPQYILPKFRGALVREGFFYPTEINCLLSLKSITCRDLCRDNGLLCNFYCELKATAGSPSDWTKPSIAFPIISYFVVFVSSGEGRFNQVVRAVIISTESYFSDVQLIIEYPYLNLSNAR